LDVKDEEGGGSHNDWFCGNGMELRSAVFEEKRRKEVERCRSRREEEARSSRC
jgi:hypothetical protein